MRGAREIGRRLLGVRNAPQFYTVTKEANAALRGEPPERVLDIAAGLLRGGHYERLGGWEIVARHRPTLESLTVRRVEALAAGLHNWYETDHFGVRVAGPVYLCGGLTQATLRRWARSSDRWWRRLALVACVPLGRVGGHGAEVLEICDLLRADRDDMVVKALSWALRELVKSDKAAVERYLRRRDAELAARVRREVRHMLRFGRKS
jgi:hypothetical protein